LKRSSPEPCPPQIKEGKKSNSKPKEGLIMRSARRTRATFRRGGYRNTSGTIGERTVGRLDTRHRRRRSLMVSPEGGLSQDKLYFYSESFSWGHAKPPWGGTFPRGEAGRRYSELDRQTTRQRDRGARRGGKKTVFLSKPILTPRTSP